MLASNGMVAQRIQGKTWTEGAVEALSQIHTQPQFLDQAQLLINDLRRLPPAQVSQLMSISDMTIDPSESCPELAPIIMNGIIMPPIKSSSPPPPEPATLILTGLKSAGMSAGFIDNGNALPRSTSATERTSCANVTAPGSSSANTPKRATNRGQFRTFTRGCYLGGRLEGES